MKAWTLRELSETRESTHRSYLEFLREESMSAGLYVLPAGGIDGQSPHSEDEVYVVLAGRGRFRAGDEVREVAAGDVIYVAAGVPHHFHDIEEELRLAVVFAPPEYSKGA